ncbi:putative RNA polymerase sigma factor (fragment) [Bradyrhizobium sp. ORS 285]
MRGRRATSTRTGVRSSACTRCCCGSAPSPVIELNHAAAVSMVDGPARALALVDSLVGRGGLKQYDLLPAVRADLLRRLDRRDEARAAYREASDATQLVPLRRLYARRLRELDAPS